MTSIGSFDMIFVVVVSRKIVLMIESTTRAALAFFLSLSFCSDSGMKVVNGMVDERNHCIFGKNKNGNKKWN